MTSEPLESDTSSSHIDYLSSLPNELLDDIFEYAYYESSPSHPLSKRLQYWFEKHFYRQISFTSFPRFQRFVTSLTGQSRKCRHVRRLILPKEGKDCRLHFETQLLLLLPQLPDLRDLRFPYSPALLTSMDHANSPLYLSRLESFGTALSLDDIEGTDLDPFSHLSSLPALNRLEIYDWNEYRLVDIRQSAIKLLPGVTTLELEGIGVDTETIKPIVDACPSLLHLELCSPWEDSSTFERCLSILPKTLSTLQIRTESGNQVPLDPVLPLFAQLRSIRLDYGCVSSTVHTVLQRLPLLNVIHLGNGNIDLVGFLSLITGPSRLTALRTIILDFDKGSEGEHIAKPSSANFDIGAELERCLITLEDWRLPGEIYGYEYDLRGIKQVIEAAGQRGVTVEGSVFEALETFKSYGIELHNRSVLYASHLKDLSYITRVRSIADQNGVSLPPLDLDSLHSLNLDRLEIAEIDLPEHDWFVLSLKNKE